MMMKPGSDEGPSFCLAIVVLLLLFGVFDSPENGESDAKPITERTKP